MREKSLQLCTEAESILTPKEDSRIIYLGTPQTTLPSTEPLLRGTTDHGYGLLGIQARKTIARH